MNSFWILMSQFRANWPYSNKILSISNDIKYCTRSNFYVKIRKVILKKGNV